MKKLILILIIISSFSFQSKAQYIPYLTPLSEPEFYPSYIADEVDELLIIDDVASELSLDGRKPLLLIHGWSFDGQPARPTGGYWDNFKDYLLNDATLRANFKPYYVRYWSNYVPIAEIAEALRIKLEEAGLHEQKIAIIGHSMGGLISRSFINEQSFTKGISKDKKCGENVDLLITLGSPHHGTPMANGPARNAEVGLSLQTFMSLVESFVFKETKYNEVNRSNLLWDNYDGLLDYQSYPNESNAWLVNLNTNTKYDSKTICYSASVTPQFVIPSNNDVEEQFKLGAWFMDQGFGFENDGIVPKQSAQFEGHSMKLLRHFNGYNHADIIRGKTSSTDLFNPIKVDISQVAPLRLTWPIAKNTYLKHSQNRKIQWEAPSTIQHVDIYFSANNGSSYTKIASEVDASSEEYMWYVPDINSSKCLIKIVDSDFEKELAISDHPFTVFHNKITVTSPTDSEYYLRSNVNTIQWTQLGLGNKVKITYVDEATGFTKVLKNEIASSIGNNSFTWQADENLTPTERGTLQFQLLELLEDFGDTEIYTFSSDEFLLLGNSSFKLDSPETSPIDFFGIEGEELAIGSIYSANWEAEGEIKYMEIYLCDKDKNSLQLLATQRSTPSLTADGSISFYIPEFFGDEFYFLGRAGLSANSIQVEYFSENSFRINNSVEIIQPNKGDENVSLRPCFVVDTIENAESYTFYLQDTLASDQYPSWEYTSSESSFCIPWLIENELQPGTIYQLTAVAKTETTQTFTDQLFFTTAATAPWDFELLHPVDIDSTEADELEVTWSRSVGASGYKVELEQGNELLFEEELYTATDTSLIVNFENAEYKKEITLKISALNNFGETAVSTSFAKKFKTDIPLISTNNEFELHNYPNPFSGETTFEFVVPTNNAFSDVSLILYDLNGKQIESIVNAQLVSGMHSILWKTTKNSTLKTGSYIYKLSINGRKTAKLLQVR
ncbi:MAG: T9SS type A sorting domain-containing protein [Prolixibacteraceae bacterium]|jgi:hypothetical protein|nr:T9SS type A sorting domain-containing protein [Prolixibacteraceae bacterium]